MSLYLHAIDTARCRMEVCGNPNLPFVSIRSGAFLLMLPRGDVFAVAAALGRVLDSPDAIPTLTLQTGDSLHIGLDVSGAHCWFSAGDAHLRIDLDVARELHEKLTAVRAFLGDSAPLGSARPC